MQSGLIGVWLVTVEKFGSRLGVAGVFGKKCGCCFGGEVYFTEEQECGNACKQEEIHEERSMQTGNNW